MNVCLFVKNENHNGTQLQHVLLGILSVREKLLKQSITKAIGHSVKVRLNGLPIPAEENNSEHSQGLPQVTVKYDATQPLKCFCPKTF